ncbi:MAG: nuclear transport factor 2 family protein [Thermomicrobiales bacterium]|nr:nuclear transport factor 2 family protein [Thermomicrobiales bacterium]
MRSLLIGLIALVLLAPSASAEATCTLTPLSLPLFDATPLAELASPVATQAGGLISEDEAHTVLEMYVACTNTGDPTLVWAMFTPRWFSTTFAETGAHYLPAFEYEIANSGYVVEDPLEFISIDGIEMTDDGRAAVTATFASADLTWTDTLILMQIDGQWLIDDVVLVSPAS